MQGRSPRAHGSAVDSREKEVHVPSQREPAADSSDSTYVEDDVSDRRARIREIGLTVRLLIGAAAFTACFRFAMQAVPFVAGKTTAVSVNIALAATATIALGGVSWALLERKLRKEQERRDRGRIKELEKRIDPRRSSSDAGNGQHHPEVALPSAPATDDRPEA